MSEPGILLIMYSIPSSHTNDDLSLFLRRIYRETHPIYNLVLGMKQPRVDRVRLDFKQHHFYIQIWKSRFSNLKIPIFKFEYPDFQIWISRSRDWSLRHWDIQIWISRYSNLNILIFILTSYHPITIKKGVTSGEKK